MDSEPSHAWQVLHPPVQPHDAGWLEVGDGHALHWSVAGHPGAPAVLIVHGGPGAGCTASDRRWFDAARWRIVTLDQRGAGASRTADPLQANTTAHLVADIEALREHLGLAGWTLFGGSWGATLALAYAQAHPRRVEALLLRGVFLASRSETEQLYGAPLPKRLAAWHEHLGGPAPGAIAAAHAWLKQEDALMAHEAPAAALRRSDAEALRLAQIQLHYARHGWFIDEGALLADMPRLRDVPGVIVQGLEDRVTPPAAARALAAAWPGTRLIEVPGAGHASTHPALAQRLVEAVSDASGRAAAAGVRPAAPPG